MNLNELREAMASDATKENASLKEENARLRQMVKDLTRNYAAVSYTHLTLPTIYSV